MDLVKASYPIQTEFGCHQSTADNIGSSIAVRFGLVPDPTRRYVPPAKEEIEKYRDVEYPKWISDVEQYLSILPHSLQSMHCSCRIRLLLSNIGSVPADNVVFDLTLYDGFRFTEPDWAKAYKTPSHPIIPRPPKAPEGKWKTLLQHPRQALIEAMGRRSEPLSSIASLLPTPNLPPPRERNAFYWKDGRPYTDVDTWSYECDEFRHKVDPEEFPAVIIMADEKECSKGVLKANVTARNLSTPFEKIVPITINWVDKEIFPVAKQCILCPLASAGSS
jgi:hypothetical protein